MGTRLDEWIVQDDQRGRKGHLRHGKLAECFNQVEEKGLSSAKRISKIVCGS
jgi:hypothetical protein